MMKKDCFEIQISDKKWNVRCFVHEILNFRYHWHTEHFELNILLNGQQYFCRGEESFLLQAGDIILVDPNEGHASYGQAQNTIAIVMQFPADIFKQFVKKASCNIQTGGRT